MIQEDKNSPEDKAPGAFSVLTLHIHEVRAEDAGTYTCASDISDTHTSKTINIKIVNRGKMMIYMDRLALQNGHMLNTKYTQQHQNKKKIRNPRTTKLTNILTISTNQIM